MWVTVPLNAANTVRSRGIGVQDAFLAWPVGVARSRPQGSWYSGASVRPVRHRGTAKLCVVGMDDFSVFARQIRKVRDSNDLEYGNPAIGLVMSLAESESGYLSNLSR